MDYTNNTFPQTGGQPNRTTDQSTSSRLIPNETTLRAGGPDMHPKIIHSQLRKTRQLQCEPVVADICPIHQDDKRHRLVKYDKLERSPATILRPTGTGDQRYILMGNRTKCTYRNDENGERGEPSALLINKQ